MHTYMRTCISFILFFFFVSFLSVFHSGSMDAKNCGKSRSLSLKSEHVSKAYFTSYEVDTIHWFECFSWLGKRYSPSLFDAPIEWQQHLQATVRSACLSLYMCLPVSDCVFLPLYVFPLSLSLSFSFICSPFSHDTLYNWPTASWPLSRNDKLGIGLI